jgi:hypothetical protein
VRAKPLRPPPDQTSTDTQLENPHQRAFLAAFEVNYCVRWAARAARISPRTHYHWLEHDSAYAAAFRELRIFAAAVLETLAIERAGYGWLQDVYYQGAVCGHVRRFDSGLMQFLLRGMMPEKYGAKTDISGPQGAPVQGKIEVVFVKPDNTEAG